MLGCGMCRRRNVWVYRLTPEQVVQSLYPFVDQHRQQDNTICPRRKREDMRRQLQPLWRPDWPCHRVLDGQATRTILAQGVPDIIVQKCTALVETAWTATEEGTSRDADALLAVHLCAVLQYFSFETDLGEPCHLGATLTEHAPLSNRWQRERSHAGMCPGAVCDLTPSLYEQHVQSHLARLSCGVDRQVVAQLRGLGVADRRPVADMRRGTSNVEGRGATGAAHVTDRVTLRCPCARIRMLDDVNALKVIVRRVTMYPALSMLAGQCEQLERCVIKIPDVVSCTQGLSTEELVLKLLAAWYRNGTMPRFVVKANVAAASKLSHLMGLVEPPTVERLLEAVQRHGDALGRETINGAGGRRSTTYADDANMFDATDASAIAGRLRSIAEDGEDDLDGGDDGRDLWDDDGSMDVDDMGAWLTGLVYEQSVGSSGKARLRRRRRGWLVNGCASLNRSLFMAYCKFFATGCYLRSMVNALRVSIPCSLIFQPFVEHDGLMYKVYVIGDAVTVIKRKSVCFDELMQRSRSDAKRAASALQATVPESHGSHQQHHHDHHHHQYGGGWVTDGGDTSSTPTPVTGRLIDIQMVCRQALTKGRKRIECVERVRRSLIEEVVHDAARGVDVAGANTGNVDASGDVSESGNKVYASGAATCSAPVHRQMVPPSAFDDVVGETVAVFDSQTLSSVNIDIRECDLDQVPVRGSRNDDGEVYSPMLLWNDVVSSDEDVLMAAVVECAVRFSRTIQAYAGLSVFGFDVVVGPDCVPYCVDLNFFPSCRGTQDMHGKLLDVLTLPATKSMPDTQHEATVTAVGLLVPPVSCVPTVSPVPVAYSS